MKFFLEVFMVIKRLSIVLCRRKGRDFDVVFYFFFVLGDMVIFRTVLNFFEYGIVFFIVKIFGFFEDIGVI